MKKTIWYMHKPGDTRDYAMTTPPSPVWAKIQHAAGFELYEVEVDVPTLIPTSSLYPLTARAYRTVLNVTEDRTPEQQEADGDFPAALQNLEKLNIGG